MGKSGFVVVSQNQLNNQVRKQHSPVLEKFKILVVVAVKYIAQKNEPFGFFIKQDAVNLTEGFCPCMRRKSDSGFAEMSNFPKV